MWMVAILPCADKNKRIKSMCYEKSNSFSKTMLTLPEPSTISRVTEGRGAAVKRLTVHGNSRANGASEAGLPRN